MSLHITHVIADLDSLSGGTTAAMVGMAGAQAKQGLDVRAIAGRPDDDTPSPAEELRQAGVRVNLVGPTRGPLRRHSDMPAAVDQAVRHCDVVHVHGLWEEPQHLAFVAARRHGKPAVLSPHGMLDRWSLSQSRLKKQLYLAWRLRRHLKRVTAFHFTTEEERQSVERFGYPGAALVVPLGLDLSEFDPLPKPGRFRDRTPGLGDRPYVLFLSRLHHKKGLELLIPAFAEVQKEHPTWALVIAGPPDSDEYLASLKSLAAEHSLAENQDVFFPGMQRGVERVEAMVDAEFFVLPSYQENFGIVVAEAAAAGLPLVISRAVNLSTWTADHGLGLLTNNQPIDLVKTLDTMISDDTRGEIGQRARVRSFGDFEASAIARRWVQNYWSLVGASTP